MKPTKKTLERLADLSYSDLRELAINNGTHDSYKALVEARDFEKVSLMLGVYNEYEKYSTAWSELEGKAANERIQLRMEFKSYLLEKICFSESLD